MKKHLSILFFFPLLATIASCRPSGDDVLTIGLEAAYAPFNYTTTSPDEGEMLMNTGFLGIGRSYVAGYDVMISEFIGLNTQHDMRYRKISWDGLIPSLQSGNIDAIIAGMTDTAERRESVLFTDPYYASDLIMLVRSDSKYASSTSIEHFSGAKLVAQIGTVQQSIIEDYATDDGDDDLYVEGLIAATPYETYPDALLALLEPNSGIDGVLAERPIAESMLEQYVNQLSLVEFYLEDKVYDPNFQITVSIALRLEDTLLRDHINEALALIDESARFTMMEAAIAASRN